MNNVILMGRLAQDPETRFIDTQKGQVAVTNFTIAVSRHFKKASGEKGEETSFIQCEAWDSGAETIQKYFSKGNPILLEGVLKQDRWEQQDGTKRSQIKVRVSSFEFLPRNTNYTENSNGETVSTNTDTPTSTTTPTTQESESDDTDIPF